MGDTRAQSRENTRIWAMARDSTGAGVTGATINIAIRRDVDGFWWNSASRVFQSSYASVAMTQADATNLAGMYYYDFSPNVGDFSAVFYATTATAAITNDPFVGDIIVGRWVDDIDEEISSRSPGTDTSVLISRMGSSFLDNDFFKVYGLIRTLEKQQENDIRRLEKKLDQLIGLLK